MAEFVKLEYLDLPEAAVVGRRYRLPMEATMGPDNPLPGCWSGAWEDGWLGTLMDDMQAHQLGDNTVGIMAEWQGEGGMFSYWIGMLVRGDAPVPDGMERLAIPAGRAAVGHIRGKDAGDICASAHEWTQKALEEAGDACEGMAWCGEYYGCPDFTTPDADGLITMQYYIPCDRGGA